MRVILVRSFCAGALSDVNSLYNEAHPYDGDMDDTSMSSRASSHVFESDALLTFDALNAYCCDAADLDGPGGARRFPAVVAAVPDGFDTEALSDVDLDGFPTLDDMRNIRSVSESITKNFGQPRPDSDNEGESDV